MAVHVLPYGKVHPGDTSDFSRQLRQFAPSGIRRLALLVKTEGNSDVNDFSRVRSNAPWQWRGRRCAVLKSHRKRVGRAANDHGRGRVILHLGLLSLYPYINVRILTISRISAMSTATMTSKGQVTIPVEVRQRMGLDTGDRIEFVEIDGGGFGIRPSIDDVRSLKGLLRKPARKVSIEDMNAAIRQRAVARHGR